jgi:hypothetical protein
MTAVCISSTRGVNPYEPANYTIATSAPTSTFDFEVRYNLLDGQSKAIKKIDLVFFLKAVIAELESSGVLAGQFFQAAVNGTNFVGPQI